MGETADADPVAAPRGGARGVEALQAEVARDDIRVLARQLVEAETRSSGASLARPVARTPGAWLRWRPYLAGVILVGAALFAGWPVYAIHAEQQAQARLAEAVQAAARGVSQGTEPGQIAGWIRERDLRALRDLYGTQRPRAAEALRAAGFDAVRAEDVSIRVDYDNATLVLTAQVPQDELHALTASANLAGEPVGRAAPVPALGPIVADRGAAIGALLLGALALAGAMWAVPALMARRRG
ncbi:MAG: hypothetical protein H6705_01210 [Myxococcales bacterium]|nr:hypothetical protein [Myxococcales bacterium]